MNASEIKVKFYDHDTSEMFGVTQATLKKVGRPSSSFLQRYRIHIGGYNFHQFLNELSPYCDTSLMVNQRLAHAMGIEERTKATVTPSHASEIQTIQYEQVDKDSKGSLPKAVDGFELQVGDLCWLKGKSIKIVACSPTRGYISTSTLLENVNQNSDDEPESDEPIIERIEPKKTTPSSSGFGKLVGMDDIIEDIRHKILLPFQKPKLAKKYLHKPLKGALFAGPNGVGKTLIARAIAEEANVSFIAIPSGADLKSITKIYKKAARRKKGCIVFIDEIDGLLKNSTLGSEGNPYVTVLQECIDGYNQNDGIFTIATTNFPGGLPDGLKRSGRLDVIINFKLPNRGKRKKLFKFFLRGIKASWDIDYEMLADMTSIYTGSDIEGVVKEAGIKAMVASQRNPKAEIINKRLISAINEYQPTGSRIMGLQKPKVSFEDIYGQDDLIRSITPQLDIISGKKEAKYSSVSNEKILLYGPSGTGKTFFAQAVANHLGLPFYYQSGSSFKSMWVGETERNIRKMFAQARTYQPLLLFIDEIDGIGKKRTGAEHNRHSDDALATFLTEMEGTASNDGVYIIGATNVPDDLDDALLTRFRRKIEMPKPNTEQRRAVLEGLFSELPDKIVRVDHDVIASATQGYTQRHLKGLYDEACLKLDSGEASKVTTNFLQSIISTHN